MNNISFDNPYLLLLLIPMLAVVLIPFFLVTKKEFLKAKNVISLILHVFIVILIALSLAQIKYEVVITETNLYVLADVSYSCNDKFDDMDKAINDLKKTTPKNTKIGVVAFGKDTQILNKPGEKIKSVRNASVDNSQTNIANALEYTSTLFDDDVIKRIVIMTDGCDTNSENLVYIVERLAAQDIYVDAMYLDNNIKEEENEVQINNIDCSSSTYLNKAENAKVLIQSSFNTDCILALSKDGEQISYDAYDLTKGFNVVNVDLDTTIAGDFNYELELIVDNDKSNMNNKAIFNQVVVEKARMLYVASAENEEKEKAMASSIYGNSYEIDYYINNNQVPFTMENLCYYDEYVLSNINISNLTNCSTFLANIDIMVSKYGKSLITLGNTYVQNNEDNEILSSLGDLLPVNYGNKDKDSKIVTLIVDISRSMESLYHLIMAKQAACTMLDLLDDKDMVAVVGFYGDVKVVQQPVYATERESIKEKINNLEAAQGTYMSAAMEQAYNILINSTCYKKEVFMISDGKPYPNETTVLDEARKMAARGIVVSTVNTDCPTGASLMEQITTITKGNYYFVSSSEDISQIVLTEIANELTETEISGEEYKIDIKSSKTDEIKGIKELPNVYGFYYSNLKPSSKLVLSTLYKTATNEYDVPIYSYWNYGNGKVSSFACNMTTWWLSKWNEENEGYKFLKNIVEYNIPNERVDYPLLVSIGGQGTNSLITVNPPSIATNASLEIEINYPNGQKEVKNAAFDSTNYVAYFVADQKGRYDFNLKYQLGEKVYTNTYSYDVSYLPEYDSFTIYDAAKLYQMVNNNGQVSENYKLKLENDNSFVSTYTYDLIFVFMSLSVLFYMIDIILRKLRWADIAALFKKKKVESGVK